MAKRELTTDQLIVFGHPGPVWPLLVWPLIVLGLLLGVLSQMGDLPSPWGLPSFLILIGVIALLRRVHILDRRRLTTTIYLGLLLPVRAVLRLPLPTGTRSFEGYTQVTVEAKTRKLARSEMNPGGGETTVYRVGFVFDHSEIWLAKFSSSSDAYTMRDEIMNFLKAGTTNFQIDEA